MQFFYDKQIRRFLTQFVRIFSEFFVEYGKDANGNTIMYRVPVRYADTNRVGSAILKNNSENVMNSVPLMVVYISALNYDRTRIQEPNFIEKRQIRERTVDPVTGNLTTTQRQAYTLERHMPVPYKLTLKMEVWTSNFEQKLQIFEQICTLFNPDLEIQSTDNYLDWTSLSYVLLSDVTWTSREIPVGTDDPIDVGTMTFELPIWLSAPAKLKKLGVIKKIIDSVYDANGNLADAIVTESILASRQYLTPLGYNVIALDGQLKLVKKFGPYSGTGEFDVPQVIGDPIDWQPLLSTLGEITNGITEVHLQDNVTGKTVKGTIAYHPTDPTVLLYTVDPDTVPSNTLPAVNSIIDPRKIGPGAGLPAATIGQRYLILNSMGNLDNSDNNEPIAWRNLDGTTTSAQENDIIQYNGSKWEVIFDSATATNVAYVTNTFNGTQYKWTGEQWQKSWEGFYEEGFWSIEI